nr:hypothetical protein [Rhodococcus oryzae]
MNRAAGDLVVFPEMSLSGYAMDAPTVALDDPRLRPLIAACRHTGAVALAGAPVHTGTGGRGIGVLAELDARARRIAAVYDLPVAFAVFAGPTGGGYVQTCGGSGVWDVTGTVVAQLGPEPGTVASAEL